MRQLAAVDLSTIIVAVARSVVDANRVLGEGSDAPMGITDFQIKYQIHASVLISGPPVAPGPKLHPRESFELTKPSRLVDLTYMTLRERIVTGYIVPAELEITSRIQPLPRVVEA